MSESELIIPVEDAVITQIRSNFAMCIGTSSTINSLYSMFRHHFRSIYNEPMCDYWMYPRSVHAVATEAASYAIIRKWKNVWQLPKYLVDYYVCWKLSLQWWWNWAMRYTSPNDCPGLRSHDALCRFFNRIGFQIVEINQKL